MPLTTYTAGEVLTAASLNANLSFAATAGGLQNVIPTSVAVGSGTGSVNATGKVSFSAASSISVNGCFTSSFQNYKVIARYTNSATLVAQVCRLRASGTNSTTNYDTSGFRSYTDLAVESYGYNTDAQPFANTPNVANATIGTIFQFFGPQEALSTNFIANTSITESANAAVHWITAFYNDNQTSFDGFTITVASGTLTGSLSVYGYSQ